MKITFLWGNINLCKLLFTNLLLKTDIATIRSALSFCHWQLKVPDQGSAMHAGRMYSRRQKVLGPEKIHLLERSA